MKKIKPEVIGFQRVFVSGRLSPSVFEMEMLGQVSNVLSFHRNVLIHKNGKPKFRLVYKNTKLPTSK